MQIPNAISFTARPEGVCRAIEKTGEIIKIIELQSRWLARVVKNQDGYLVMVDGCVKTEVIE